MHVRPHMLSSFQLSKLLTRIFFVSLCGSNVCRCYMKYEIYNICPYHVYIYISSHINIASYDYMDHDNDYYLRSYQKNSILVKHTLLLKSICRYGEYCFVLHSSQQSSPLETHL